MDELIREFFKYVKPIIKDGRYQILKKYIHHGNTSVYRHSVLVAFIAFKIAKKRKKIDMDSLIKGALLHDYFKYDWHILEGRKRLHGFRHPWIAAKNAIDDFNVNKKVVGIIQTHMWPLTFYYPPHSREAWIVSKADKIATHIDMVKKRKLKKSNK